MFHSQISILITFATSSLFYKYSQQLFINHSLLLQKKYHRKKKSPKTKTAAKVESNLEGQMISMDNIDNSELSDRIEMSPKNEKIVAVVDSDGANMRPNSSKKKLKKSKVGKKGRKAKKIKKEKEVEEKQELVLVKE